MLEYLLLILMVTVQTILDLQKSSNLTYERRIEFKAQGRDIPIFVFDGKRQCRLSEQYDKLEWLTGCPIRKSLFCFPCLIFKYNSSAWSFGGIKDLGNFTNHVQKHAKSTTHLTAVTAMRLLGKLRINEALDEGARVSRQIYNEEVTKNREMLKHHVAAAVFLATQGLAFRGHDQVKYNANRGNFVGLVALLGRFSSNPLVQTAVTSFNPVFSGFSSDIQNDIISCLYDLVMEEIKHRISIAPFVSILADECTDVSNISQLAVCVRLVYKGSVYEHLIDLVDVSADRSATGLAAVMTRSLETAGVDKNKPVIGQSYDGANNMAGKNHSVQILLQIIWPLANFVHCYAHKWALVVKSACADIKNVTVFFGFMHTVINFFRASPKRSSFIKCTLPRPAATRWLSRGKCTSVIVSNYNPICIALDKIAGDSDFDATARAEAKGLLDQMKSYDNVFLLLVFNRIFGLSDIMTRKLQCVSLDPADVGSKVSDYRRNLCGLRSESTFNEFCGEAERFQPDAPVRRRKRKINEAFLIDSGYTPSAEETIDNKSHLRAIFFEIIDVLTTQLDCRFQNVGQYNWVRLFQPQNFDTFKADSLTVADLTKALYVFNPALVPEKEAFRNELYILYGDSGLRTALNDAKDASSVLKTMHDLDMCDALPLVTNALTASQTLALTSVACERNFSVLRRLKTYMRSTMGQERLRSLMLLSIENELLLQMSAADSFADKVIDRFASMKERQIKLVYRK